MFKWNAALYDSFGKERLQPSLDLASRLDGQYFERIIDIGCGSGMSTTVLCNKFPHAEIKGVDLSESMLEKAQTLNLDVEWIRRDCSLPLDDLGKYDLVFSNAFLQWIPDQATFLKDLSKLLSSDGLIAFQVPNWTEMPIKKCIDKVALGFEEFNSALETDCKSLNINNYYDILARSYTKIEIWQTNYAHLMRSYDEIITFISSTGLQPYLSQLSECKQQLFIKELKKELEFCYPMQENNMIIFPFERIFFIACSME